MSNQLQITGGAKVRNLNGVITGTTGVLDSLPINAANGIPQLDSSGKILVSQLPNSVMEYKGTWNVATNTPYLVNGVGNAGDVYMVTGAATGGTTHDFGAGPILFYNGDQTIYDGAAWERASGSSGTVTSVAVTESSDALNITGSPITTSGTINIGFAGTSAQYVAGDGSLITFPSLSGYVPYTGATNDVNIGTHNLYANNYFDGFTSVAASSTPIVLTIASNPSYLITGSGGQTIKLPDATTLPNGAEFFFNNNQSTGSILVNNNSNTLVKSIPSGGYLILTLIDNSIAAGSWDAHFQAPSNVSWSTNTFDYSGSFTSGTWNGNIIAINRGGTGASTASAALSNLGGIGLTSLSASAPLSYNNTTGAFSISQATTSTNGYLSSTDWNTFNNKQNALGYVPVSGTGSVNYISKFTGSTTISNSGIYEGAAGKISINNTNTTYALDVTGVANFSNAVYANAFLTNSSAGITIGVDGGGTGGALKFTQNTSTSVGGPSESSISTSGNSKFYFYAGISSGVFKAFQFDNSSLTNNTVRTYTLPDASGTLALTSALTGVIYGSGANNQIAFFNATNSIGSSPNFYWDATNNRLGINQGTPLYSLDVTGTARITGNTIFGGTLGNGTYTYTLPSATGTLALTSQIPSLTGYIQGSGTSGYLPAFTGSTTIGNSVIQSSTSGITVNGNGNILLAQSSTAAYTAGFNNIVSDTGGFSFYLGASTSRAYFNISGLTAGRNYTFPDASGTLALTSNILSAVSGTTNYHAKFTATNAVGTSGIYEGSAGYISIGNTNSTYNLDVTGTGRFTGALTISGGQVQIKQGGNTFNDGLRIYATGGINWTFVAGGDNNLYLGYNGSTSGTFSYTTGIYTPSSDYNKKKDFEESTIGLDAILNIKPTLFRMKVDSSETPKTLGFIAQQVKEFIPQAYVEIGETEDKFIGLNDRPIVAALVKAIQESHDIIKSLEARIETLENK